MAKPTRRMKKSTPTPDKCYFCTENKEPVYTDVSGIQRFISDRGKIYSRSRSGICAKHQRRLSDAVKYARHLAMLPFVSRD
jgi:small subunit ribosomal protein S18